jgi:transcriptional regulator with XRE-family HTH domain
VNFLDQLFIPLKQLRKREGLTQIQLAEASGISQQAISKVEVGKSQPNYHSAVAMAKVLDCTPEEIMGYTTIKPKKVANKTLDALKAKLKGK